MIPELDSLIDESIALRMQIDQTRKEYDIRRKKIFELLTAADMKSYVHGMCKAVRTEAVSFESVSKELLIKALQDVDIPREKKVFIWNTAIKEVQRPAMVTLQIMKNG
jgi:hypothetical protein